MKKVFKIILIIFLITGISVAIPNNIVEGTSDIIDEVEQKAAGTDVTNDTKDVAGIVGEILSVLQIIAALVAAVMIASMGFRYIIDTPEVKEELKKNMMPVVIGIMLVFFALSISKFLIGIFEKNAPGTQIVSEEDKGNNNE